MAMMTSRSNMSLSSVASSGGWGGFDLMNTGRKTAKERGTVMPALNLPVTADANEFSRRNANTPPSRSRPKTGESVGKTPSWIESKSKNDVIKRPASAKARKQAKPAKDDLRSALGKLKSVALRTCNQSSHRGPSMSDFMDKKLDSKNFGAQLKMTFGLKFRPGELQALMLHFDKDGDGTICYGEFTNAFFKLGKEARAEQRKSPSHISLQYGTASEVSKIFLKRFKEKLGIGFKDGLKSHFEKYDTDSSGSIGPKEFRKVLMDFEIRVTNQQFAQIMQIFDLDGSEEIDFAEFVDILENQDMHTKFRASQGPGMHDWQITGQFASCVAGKWDKIAAAFIAFDREQTGSLTYGEVKLILQRLDIIDERMTDANFRILMKHYDSDGDGDISYVEFLKHFASSVDGTHLDQKFAVNERIQPLLAGHENSMVIENDSNFKTVATSKWPKVMRQIKLVADQDSMGFVTKSQFRRILDSCSICLSNAYFEEISQRFEVPVHNNYFLHDLFMQEMGLQRPATASGRPISSMSNSSSVTSLRSAYSNSSLLQKDVSISYLARNGATTESLLSIEKVEKKIQKRMKKDAAKVRNAFDKYDKEGSGLVSRDGFLMSLNSLDLDISPEEASLLWKKHATVVDKGVRFANYRIVLKTMYESQHRNNQSSKNSPSKSLSRGPGSQTWELENIERYFERPKTTVVASKMQMLDSHRCKTICQSWKDIRAQFQQRDRNPASKGTVSSVDFQSVLMWFGVSLDDKEMYKLMLFYDQTNTGRIMYNDFLKAVLKHKVI